VNQPFETRNAVYFGRNKWINALCAVPFAIALIGGLTALIIHHPGPAVLMPHLVIGGLSGLVYARNKNPRPRRLKASVRAGSEGVQIDSASAVPFLPRAQIREGFVLPTMSDAPRVRLTCRGLRPPVYLSVGDEAQARGFLRALGLDASQRVASFRVLSRMVAHRRWIIGAMLGIFASMVALMAFIKAFHSPFPFAILLPLIVVTFIVSMLLPSRLELGADGVLIKWAWRKRFIAHGDIEMVMPLERGFGSSHLRGLSLTLRSGEQIQVPVTQSRGDDDRVAIIEQRMREARESHKQGGADAWAMLQSRKERSVSDWITTLRSIGAGANAAHRVAPVAPERLWRIVEDPSARAIARAAAAVALGAGIDDEGRARLKAAADATAAPKLRIALQAAAVSADEEALEEALQELEAADMEALSIKTDSRRGPGAPSRR
jgi:hypothetical protein